MASANSRPPRIQALASIEELGSQIAGRESAEAAVREISSIKARLEVENTYLQEEIRREHNFEEIIGNSPNY
ncbi:MAG: hypothetical protein WDO18_17360 [Acidobacteriota bacterium]